MNRRSLLKTIGACLGFGLWSEAGEGEEGKKVCSGPVEQTNPACWSEKEHVCDPLLLPVGDWEKGIHNATFVRSVDGGVAWVRLMTGQYRLVENAFTGRGEESAGMRVVLQSDEDHGLFICGWLD